PVSLGIGRSAYSLFTNYDLGVWKVAPMAVHNLIDIVAGALLTVSPWLFGFAGEANASVPLAVAVPAVHLHPARTPSPRAARPLTPLPALGGREPPPPALPPQRRTLACRSWIWKRS